MMQRLLILAMAVCASSSVFSQSLPQYFSRVQVGGAITYGTVMAFAPDGRIFVAEQAGTLHVIKNGVQLATPFIKLSVNAEGERGLIGIAVDPDFNTNQYIYLYYTTAENGLHNRVSRFTANGDVAVAGSEQIILELDALSSATNHNGGALGFGKDGKLYVAIGENANGAYAQNLDIYHGKILRINKDGSAPADNPFPAGTERGKRIWAYGLRNPYTFSVHPTSGRILVNDVGQGTYEEVNDATTGGKNFGWATSEGPTTNPDFTSPIFYYKHDGPEPTGCAITGGTFLSSANTNYPSEYHEKYFVVDACGNWLYYFDPAAPGVATKFGDNIGDGCLNISVGPDGNIYYVSRGDSKVYKLVYNPPAEPPVITTHPQPAAVVAGQPASFNVNAAGAEPITYQWYKNTIAITDETSSTLTINATTEDDQGDYYVSVTNPHGTVTSNTATLTVSLAENQRPVATITKPVEGDLYRAGDVIAYEGTGVDPEDGTLDASAFSWAINFHHDTHKHDQPAIAGIAEGEFEVPNRGETSANVWYRFILTVTDPDGATSKDSVDVHPLTSQLTFETVPPGIQVTIDGQPFTAPITITSVEGLERDVVYATGQELDGIAYFLYELSEGEQVEQTIVTPGDDITYTATYAPFTGLEDEKTSLTVYPNPVKDWIHIQQTGITSVNIVSSIGKYASLTPVHHASSTSVDVSHLSPGVYVLFYSGDFGSAKRTIVISK